MVGWFIGLFFLPRRAIHLPTIRGGNRVECMWTVVPMCMVFTLSAPSYKILCLNEDLVDPKLTLKIIGRQWYWTYEYRDYGEVRFDSYMLPEEELPVGGLRNLEVDNPAILPYHLWVRLLVTSTDVIHSWTLPGLGVKIDGVPGRINQVPLYFKNPGVYYGQCSEICGAQHRFMPVCVEVIAIRDVYSLLIA